MSITALRYLGIRTQSLKQWSTFSSGILGMQQVDRGGKSTAYRMDDHKQRLVVKQSNGDSLAFMGWEVADQQSDNNMSKAQASIVFATPEGLCMQSGKLSG